MLKVRLMAALAVAAALLAAASGAEKFRTRLAPVAMDISIGSAIAGSGAATATLESNRLTVSGAFDGLLSNATAGQLRLGVAPGATLWQARLGTSVQGYPVTFSIDGRQYVALTTGLGGGSPRQAPETILPEIQVPGNGNSLYVFALPEKK